MLYVKSFLQSMTDFLLFSIAEWFSTVYCLYNMCSTMTSEWCITGLYQNSLLNVKNCLYCILLQMARCTRFVSKMCPIETDHLRSSTLKVSRLWWWERSSWSATRGHSDIVLRRRLYRYIAVFMSWCHFDLWKPCYGRCCSDVCMW